MEPHEDSASVNDVEREWELSDRELDRTEISGSDFGGRNSCSRPSSCSSCSHSRP